MAKARKITGIKTSTGASEGAALVLHSRFDEILQFQRQALKPKDVVGVHDMRVATRRLRSVLRDFKPLLKKSALKPVKNEIKQLADALGSVRDLDVAIITLEKLKLKTRNPQIKKGVGKLLGNRSALREKARVQLVAFLKNTDLSKLHKRFDSAVEEAVQQKKSSQSGSFEEFGLAAISVKLEEFRNLSKTIYRPFDAEGLHEFRLSTKRLRYAIELFATRPKLVKSARKLSRMQDFLGEVHDCDLWIEALSNDLLDDALKQPDYKTDTWLLSRFTEIRSKNYRSALALWGSWEEAGLLEKISAAICKE